MLCKRLNKERNREKVRIIRVIPLDWNYDCCKI